MQYRVAVTVSMVIGTVVHAIPARPQITSASQPNLATFAKRSQPEASGSSILDAPMTIAAGESFDGGNYMFDRGVSCTGQEEGGDSDAVFILEPGASLSNVIIGPNQVEGVHCNGGCTITNVWWEAVCEDAFSIKKQESSETTTINGGGAVGAEDKVVQHNGGGTVVINDFTVSDFGKLYRSCGNCDDMPDRHVRISGGSASDGDVLVGINTNMGDTASISGMTITNVDSECLAYEGVTDGSEPEEIGTCNASGSGTESVSDIGPSTTATPATTTVSRVTSVDSFSTPTAIAYDGSYNDSDESTDGNDGDESSDDNEDDSVHQEDGSDQAFNFGYLEFGSR